MLLLLALAFKHQPNFPPGEGWHYSHTNYLLLELIIEKLSGLSLQTMLEQRIFRPLGSLHTSMPSLCSAALPDPHPQGYTVFISTNPFFNVTNWNLSWGWAAGSAISTLRDLNIWARALARGALLQPAMQQERLEGLQTRGYGLGSQQSRFHLTLNGVALRQLQHTTLSQIDYVFNDDKRGCVYLVAGYI